jgi:hypothetical protein
MVVKHGSEFSDSFGFFYIIFINELEGGYFGNKVKNESLVFLSFSGTVFLINHV